MSDATEVYTEAELIQTLARLDRWGYVAGGFGVKELVEKGWVELEDPPCYQYAKPTPRGLIALGNAVLVEQVDD